MTARGWDFAKWNGLSESEKLFWFGYDQYRQTQIETFQQFVTRLKHNPNGDPNAPFADIPAYMMTLLAELGV